MSEDKNELATIIPFPENNKLASVIPINGEMQPATDGSELDEHGLMIYEDSINFKLNHKELVFIHGTVCKVLEQGLVPPESVGPCIELIERLAAQEQEVYKMGALLLPVNFFAGLWHALNTGRKFDIYHKRKLKSKWLDNMVMSIAKDLDMYHKVKSHEANEEKMNSKKFFKDVLETPTLALPPSKVEEHLKRTKAKKKKD